jgi:Ras-related protein Rab-28
MKHSSGDPVCKLILLGNGSVGKSSIIARFVEDGFQRQYKQTIGLDFYEKKIQLSHDKRILLQVWDIGGQNINSKMLGMYIYGAEIIFLCYDVTDSKSFSDLDDWLALVQRADADADSDGINNDSTSIKNSKDMKDKKKKRHHVYVIGNKMDLIGLRTVSSEAHSGFIHKHKLAGGFLLSAHSGDNVLRTVHQIAGRAVGMELTEYELSFLDAPVKAYALASAVDEENRTQCASAIEEEDRRLEELKLKKNQRTCFIM